MSGTELFPSTIPPPQKMAFMMVRSSWEVELNNTKGVHLHVCASVSGCVHECVIVVLNSTECLVLKKAKHSL